MSFHYWRNLRPAEQAALHHAQQQLPRRDARGARGRQRRALQVDLPAAADGRDHGALARLLRARGGRELGSAFAPQVRADAGSARAARRRSRRGDRRAAGAMRRQHAHVSPGLPGAAARRLRRAPGAADRRRDRRGIRAHRHALRVRTGGDPPGPDVPVEGTDRRLPAALRGARDGADLPGVLRRVHTPERVPALAQLHGQRARLHRRARKPRHLRATMRCIERNRAARS